MTENESMRVALRICFSACILFFHTTSFSATDSHKVDFRKILFTPQQLLRLSHKQKLNYYHALQEYLTAIEQINMRGETKKHALFSIGFNVAEAQSIQSPSGISVGRTCIIGGYWDKWHADQSGHLWCGLSPAERKAGKTQESYQCGADGESTKCNVIPYLYDQSGQEHCVATTPYLSRDCGRSFADNYDSHPDRLAAAIQKVANNPADQQQWDQFLSGIQKEHDDTVDFRDNNSETDQQKVAADEKLKALDKFVAAAKDLRDQSPATEQTEPAPPPRPVCHRPAFMGKDAQSVRPAP